ncbi:GILT-like protein 3 [Toxorhynchites rutilus septentrionalis]|uniref:GILT-like protein 3 n=1 Tax=Toxorhynchites rutilus septentrionalis TaxID=329112 RepID=UPI00247A95A5|nr:GILT-like protein 3 [Toxorhynchites rutilus septentrionalis]XP_055637001.1 GILT-like protein 3 [Toxorhynchites rutilus septentrionalis]
MRALVEKPATKLPIMMMIGISWLAIMFSLSAGQEIDRPSEDSNGTSTGGDERLQVTIYYETLCYDSISFITNHLAPSWGRHRDRMDLKLVPFGKAYIDDSNPSEPVYYCQHGHRECTLNILHGCILDKLPLEKAFPVIACLMKGFRTSFDQCYKQDLASKEEIQKCANGEQGAKLFKRSSDETNRVATPLSFVPTIEVDKNYDIFEQDRWLYRFDRTFREEFENKFNKTLD